LVSESAQLSRRKKFGHARMARTSSTYMTTIYTSQISSGRVDLVSDYLRDDPAARRAFNDQIATGLGDSNSKHRHGQHDDVRRFELGDQLVSSRPARSSAVPQASSVRTSRGSNAASRPVSAPARPLWYALHRGPRRRRATAARSLGAAWHLPTAANRILRQLGRGVHRRP
jgi:hypothetical protein